MLSIVIFCVYLHIIISSEIVGVYNGTLFHFYKIKANRLITLYCS